jgi:elongator complex protein 3
VSTETGDPEAFEQVCQELVERILAGDIERDDL